MTVPINVQAKISEPAHQTQDFDLEVEIARSFDD